VSVKLLDGIKVVDFSWALVGPLTTRALTEYGAEVIRIESNTRPGQLRLGGPYKDNIVGLNRSGNFNQWNTGKLSLALNLALPKAVEIAKRLVARADIVVENFAGGVMNKMGLGYEELRKVKPDIIMLSSCMMGQTGPYSSHPGFGGFLAALTGFYQISGWPDQEPPFIGPYTDYIAPHFNISTILSALIYRRRTGSGTYIDVSQYETAVHFQAPIVLDNVVNHRVAGREGNEYAHAAPHNAYPCRGDDRWCAIAVFTDGEWESFCRVIGNPDWTREPRFNTLQARKDNEAELDKLVEQWTVNHSAEEIMQLMQAAGVPAGVLQTAEDLMECDPQLKHRHFFWELDHPEISEYRAPGPPYQLSRVPYEISRAPLLGEHSEYVLKEILGMSDEEVAELVTEGIID